MQILQIFQSHHNTSDLQVDLTQHESMVRGYRRHLSLALLGVDKTADNVNEARCILHPPPDTEGYKLLQNMLGKQQRIDFIQANGNCLFRALSKEILGNEKFHHLIR